MRSVVVLGAGAVGSVFGARLVAAGHTVLLVGRPVHVDAIRARGLIVEGVRPGTFHPEVATTLPTGARADAVLLTVKSFDLEAAATELGRALAPTPTAILGNGLGLEGVVLRSLRAIGWGTPEAVVVRAVHTVPATLLGPGTVRAAGEGEIVFPEPGSGGSAAAAVQALLELFRTAGFSVRTSSAFDLELWRKAAVNAAINPVTALRQVPNGALGSGPARREAEQLLAEAVEVARASGTDLRLDVAGTDLDRVIRATAANRSSMLQDVDRGRPTEVDAISGEILRRGQALGLRLPATAAAIERLRRRLAGRPPSAQP